MGLASQTNFYLSLGDSVSSVAEKKNNQSCFCTHYRIEGPTINTYKFLCWCGLGAGRGAGGIKAESRPITYPLFQTKLNSFPQFRHHYFRLPHQHLYIIPNPTNIKNQFFFWTQSRLLVRSVKFNQYHPVVLFSSFQLEDEQQFCTHYSTITGYSNREHLIFLCTFFWND